MEKYETSKLIRELKKVFIDKVVQSGFESEKIYNFNNIKNLSDIDVNLLIMNKKDWKNSSLHTKCKRIY